MQVKKKNITFLTYGSQKGTLGFVVFQYWTIFLEVFQ